MTAYLLIVNGLLGDREEYQSFRHASRKIYTDFERNAADRIWTSVHQKDINDFFRTGNRVKYDFLNSGTRNRHVYMSH